MSRFHVLSVPYLLLLCLHVYTGQFTDWPDTVLWITKPLLMLFLLLWWFGLLPLWRSLRFGRLVALGLAFSWFGDIFLMFQQVNDQYFIYGLSAFLLAHVAYIAAFTCTYRNDYEVALLRKQGWLLVAVVGYGVYFFGKLSPSLGSMVAPVMLYTTAIMVMLLLALNRWGKVGTASFWWITIGAVLFVVSDSVLAYNKFVHPLSWSHATIMGTYGLAQWAIFGGARLQVKQQAG